MVRFSYRVVDFRSQQSLDMNTPSNIPSIIGHGLAGVAIAVIPFLLVGLPTDWQAMTVAGLLSAALKWAHLYYQA